MSVIQSFVDKQGRRVIRKWERIQQDKRASWLSVIGHGFLALLLVSLACIVLSLCWLVAQVKCMLAWTWWKLAQARAWCRTGRTGTGRGRGVI